MEKVEGVKKKNKGKETRYGRHYGFEVKLRCVKLRLEGGVLVTLLSKEVGANADAIRRWVRPYREGGKAGLRNQIVPTESQRKLPGPVRDKIIEIKKREPFGGGRNV